MRSDALAAASLAPYLHDPLGFVETQYPWGQGELIGQPGPRDWQAEILKQVGDHFTNPETRFRVCRVSVSSGHGIGKSALMAMLTHWGITTMVDAQGVITANTETQLRTKTWPELHKWTNMLAVRDFFQLEGTTFRGRGRGATWRMDAIPWSEHNTESFQGLHNAGKRLVILMDESSAIHDKIFEVTEGALTDEDTEILWVALGNPTRPTGRFFDCFSRLRHRWYTHQIDARDVPGTARAQQDEWIEDYGLDSDFVRVRVRGLFPRTGSNQLISSEIVTAAQGRDVAPKISDPLILGVDVARFGEDQSVIYSRKGKVAGVHGGPWKYRELDNVTLAHRIAEKIRELKPQVVNVDGGGPGGGVVDILREWGYEVNEVWFGGAPFNKDYANKRAEMWCAMRDWLDDGGAIPWSDKELANELSAQTYKYREGKDNALVLTPKDIMKKDGLPSPDSADSLAVTWAFPVNPVTDVSRGLGDVRSAVTEYVGGWE